MDKPATVDHPVHDLIRARWSPRAFADKPVDGPTLASVFEASRWGSSSFNEQPWRFIVATKDDATGYGKALDCLVPGNQTWAKAAPVLIFPVASTRFAHNDKPNRHAWHDVGLAVAQLALEATARGLVLHQMGGIVADQVRETYGVPEGFEPVTGIALGYPGDPDRLPESLRDAERAPRKRRPASESVFAGTWGAAAPWTKSG